MEKMNLAEGTLVLLGLLLVLCAAVYKVTGFNLIDPAIRDVSNIGIAAVLCFVMGLIVSKYSE